MKRTVYLYVSKLFFAAITECSTQGLTETEKYQLSSFKDEMQGRGLDKFFDDRGDRRTSFCICDISGKVCNTVPIGVTTEKGKRGARI